MSHLHDLLNQSYNYLYKYNVYFYSNFYSKRVIMKLMKMQSWKVLTLYTNLMFTLTVMCLVFEADNSAPSMEFFVDRLSNLFCLNSMYINCMCMLFSLPTCMTLYVIRILCLSHMYGETCMLACVSLICTIHT